MFRRYEDLVREMKERDAALAREMKEHDAAFAREMKERDEAFAREMERRHLSQAEEAREFMREVILRMDAIADRAIKKLDELHEDHVVQHRVLVRILGRLDGNGPSGATAPG